MAGQRLGQLGMHAGAGQIAYERVPQTVEVGHQPGMIAIGQHRRSLPLGSLRRRWGLFNPLRPGRVEVRPQHFGRVFLPWKCERLRGRQLACQVRLEQRRRLGPQWQAIFASPLAICRLDGHGRLRGVEVETAARQCPQLVGPQAALHRQPIDDGPLGSADSKSHRSRVGRLNQPPQFLDGQSPPVVSAVGPHVLPLQMA
ncbi:MAG TPA: hypothetical protein VGI40_27205 [Pirellulaceae bacterium]